MADQVGLSELREKILDKALDVTHDLKVDPHTTTKIFEAIEVADANGLGRIQRMLRLDAMIWPAILKSLRITAPAPTSTIDATDASASLGQTTTAAAFGNDGFSEVQGKKIRTPSPIKSSPHFHSAQSRASSINSTNVFGPLADLHDSHDDTTVEHAVAGAFTSAAPSISPVSPVKDSNSAKFTPTKAPTKSRGRSKSRARSTSKNSDSDSESGKAFHFKGASWSKISGSELPSAEKKTKFPFSSASRSTPPFPPKTNLAPSSTQNIDFASSVHPKIKDLSPFAQPGGIKAGYGMFGERPFRLYDSPNNDIEHEQFKMASSLAKAKSVIAFMPKPDGTLSSTDPQALENFWEKVRRFSGDFATSPMPFASGFFDMQAIVEYFENQGCTLCAVVKASNDHADTVVLDEARTFGERTDLKRIYFWWDPSVYNFNSIKVIEFLDADDYPVRPTYVFQKGTDRKRVGVYTPDVRPFSWPGFVHVVIDAVTLSSHVATPSHPVTSALGATTFGKSSDISSGGQKHLFKASDSATSPPQTPVKLAPAAPLSESSDDDDDSDLDIDLDDSQFDFKPKLQKPPATAGEPKLRSSEAFKQAGAEIKVAGKVGHRARHETVVIPKVYPLGNRVKKGTSVPDFFRRMFLDEDFWISHWYDLLDPVDIVKMFSLCRAMFDEYGARISTFRYCGISKPGFYGICTTGDKDRPIAMTSEPDVRKEIVVIDGGATLPYDNPGEMPQSLTYFALASLYNVGQVRILVISRCSGIDMEDITNLVLTLKALRHLFVSNCTDINIFNILDPRMICGIDHYVGAVRYTLNPSYYTRQLGDHMDREDQETRVRAVHRTLLPREHIVRIHVNASMHLFDIVHDDELHPANVNHVRAILGQLQAGLSRCKIEGGYLPGHHNLDKHEEFWNGTLMDQLDEFLQQNGVHISAVKFARDFYDRVRQNQLPLTYDQFCYDSERPLDALQPAPSPPAPMWFDDGSESQSVNDFVTGGDDDDEETEKDRLHKKTRRALNQAAYKAGLYFNSGVAESSKMNSENSAYAEIAHFDPRFGWMSYVFIPQTQARASDKQSRASQFEAALQEYYRTHGINRGNNRVAPHGTDDDELDLPKFMLHPVIDHFPRLEVKVPYDPNFSSDHAKQQERVKTIGYREKDRHFNAVNTKVALPFLSRKPAISVPESSSASDDTESYGGWERTGTAEQGSGDWDSDRVKNNGTAPTTVSGVSSTFDAVDDSQDQAFPKSPAVELGNDWTKANGTWNSDPTTSQVSGDWATAPADPVQSEANKTWNSDPTAPAAATTDTSATPDTSTRLVHKRTRKFAPNLVKTSQPAPFPATPYQAASDFAKTPQATPTPTVSSTAAADDYSRVNPSRRRLIQEYERTHPHPKAAPAKAAPEAEVSFSFKGLDISGAVTSSSETVMHDADDVFIDPRVQEPAPVKTIDGVREDEVCPIALHNGRCHDKKCPLTTLCRNNPCDGDKCSKVHGDPCDNMIHAQDFKCKRGRSCKQSHDSRWVAIARKFASHQGYLDAKVCRGSRVALQDTLDYHKGFAKGCAEGKGGRKKA